MIRFSLPLIALALATGAQAQDTAPQATTPSASNAAFRQRTPSEEGVYFVLPDRF